MNRLTKTERLRLEQKVRENQYRGTGETARVLDKALKRLEALEEAALKEDPNAYGTFASDLAEPERDE